MFVVLVGDFENLFVQKIFSFHLCKTVLQNMRRETMERERLRRRRKVEEHIARTLQRLCRGRMGRQQYQRRLRALALQRDRELLVEAAIRAQRLARGFLCRKRCERLVKEARAKLIRMEAAVSFV